MVQDISPPVDEDGKLMRRLLTFQANPDAEGKKEYEGVLIEVVDGPTKSMRILHSDGLVRMWERKDVSSVECVHDNPYSVEEVDFKVKRSIFRGGTRKVNQLKGEALVNKRVEVWNEMNRLWRKAKVLQDDREVVVEYEDEAVVPLNPFDVWRLEGEDEDDGIMQEKEETIAESVSTQCLVTSVPERGLVNIYKKLCSPEMPCIRVTETMAWIGEERGAGGEQTSTLVHLPHPANMKEPIDAVMDRDYWLVVTYTPVPQDTEMAAE